MEGGGGGSWPFMEAQALCLLTVGLFKFLQGWRRAMMAADPSWAHVLCTWVLSLEAHSENRSFLGPIARRQKDSIFYIKIPCEVNIFRRRMKKEEIYYFIYLLLIVEIRGKNARRLIIFFSDGSSQHVGGSSVSSNIYQKKEKKGKSDFSHRGNIYSHTPKKGKKKSANLSI